MCKIFFSIFQSKIIKVGLKSIAFSKIVLNWREKDKSRPLKDISIFGRSLKDIFKKEDAAPPLHME
jgi:hypothetical protein